MVKTLEKVSIGIDPGLSGAAIALDEYGTIVGCTAMPHVKTRPPYRKHNQRSVLDINILGTWLSCFEHISAITIEESAPFGMGVSSAYTSGMNNGRLHSLCEVWKRANGGGLYLVTAKEWQAKVIKDQSHEGKWSKEASIELAVSDHGDYALFSKPKKTADGFADAAHIAAYGWDLVREDWVA